VTFQRSTDKVGARLDGASVEALFREWAHGLVVQARAGGDVLVEPVQAHVSQQLVLSKPALHIPVAVAPCPELLHNPSHQTCTVQHPNNQHPPQSIPLTG
jgi:hypothetical protein